MGYVYTGLICLVAGVVIMYIFKGKIDAFFAKVKSLFGGK